MAPPPSAPLENRLERLGDRRAVAAQHLRLVSVVASDGEREAVPALWRSRHMDVTDFGQPFRGNLVGGHQSRVASLLMSSDATAILRAVPAFEDASPQDYWQSFEDTRSRCRSETVGEKRRGGWLGHRRVVTLGEVSGPRSRGSSERVGSTTTGTASAASRSRLRTRGRRSPRHWRYPWPSFLFTRCD
jgi:hypothetical protein